MEKIKWDPNRKAVGYVPLKEHGDVLHICWMIHNACNHKCSYCHPNTYAGSFKWLNYEKVIHFLDRVFQHYENKDNILFSFTGGEPTLWPDFLRLCEYLKGKGCEVGMTTNGSRRHQFFEKSAPYFDWISLSYHPEFTRDDHMLGTIRTLMKHTPLGLRLMMHKEKHLWDKCIKFVDKVKEIEDIPVIHIEYAPLIDDFATEHPSAMEYEPWQQELFKPENISFTLIKDRKSPVLDIQHVIGNFQGLYDNGETFAFMPNDIVAHGQNNFKGWSCYVGVDQLFIDSWGFIYGSNCKAGGSLGSINDTHWEFPTQPLICPKTFCACNTDIMTRKYHPDHPDFSQSIQAPGDHCPWARPDRVPKFDIQI